MGNGIRKASLNFFQKQPGKRCGIGPFGNLVTAGILFLCHCGLHTWHGLVAASCLVKLVKGKSD